MSNKGAVLPAFSRQWWDKGDRIGTEVIIKAFNPTMDERTTTHWNGNKRESVHTRAYVKEQRRPTPEIRILAPERLWSSPLETLASVEKSRAPQDMVGALVERIGNLYEAKRWGEPTDGRYVEPDYTGYFVHIEMKVQKKIDATEKARAARQRALIGLLDASYNISKLEEYAERVRNDTQRALNNLKRSKVPFGPMEILLEQQISDLFQDIRRIQATMRNIKQSS